MSSTGADNAASTVIPSSTSDVGPLIPSTESTEQKQPEYDEEEKARQQGILSSLQSPRDLLVDTVEDFEIGPFARTVMDKWDKRTEGEVKVRALNCRRTIVKHRISCFDDWL